MPLTRELSTFITGPVMTIVGTCGTGLEPEVGRGVGTSVADGGLVEVVVSGWQWPGTVANLRAGGWAAVTCSRPSDYVSYQLKGPARVRDATPADIAASERYVRGIAAALGQLGVAPGLVAAWTSNRGAVVAQVDVRDVFIQTPGPKAGLALGGTP